MTQLPARLRPRLENPAGQPALSWRVGTRDEFLARMLWVLREAPERLPGGRSNPLAHLPVDAAGGLVLPLLSAWAAAGDILTFYQERILNEAYLRTATQSFSVEQLVRLLGYQPRGGLSSETWLSFLVNPAASPSTFVIPAGTQAQSAPSGSGLPQAFETSEAFVADASFAALTLHLPTPSQPSSLRGDATVLLLTGVSVPLKAGDVLVLAGFVGAEPLLRPLTVQAVAKASARAVTLVSVAGRLDGEAPTAPPTTILEPSLARVPRALGVLGADLGPWATQSFAKKVAAGGVRRGGVAATGAGGAFAQANGGLPQGSVQCLLAEGDFLYAGTAGSGIYALDRRSPSAGFSAVGGMIAGRTVLSAVASAGLLYVGTANGVVYRSPDAGVTWDVVPGGSVSRSRLEVVWDTTTDKPRIASKDVTISDQLPGSAVRALTAWTSAEGTTTLAAGTDDGVYVTVVGSGLWKPHNLGLPGASGGHVGVVVRALAWADGHLVAATDQGVFVHRPLGWERAAGIPSTARGTSLAWDGTTLLVGTDAGVYAGTTGGLTPTTVTRAVAAVASAAGAWYAGTATGLLASADGGATWAHVPSNLHTPPVTVLAPVGGGLAAAAPFDGFASDEWPGLPLAAHEIDLSKVESSVVPGGFVVARQADRPSVALRVHTADIRLVDRFGTSARTTVLRLEGAGSLASYDRRQIALLGGSVSAPLSGLQVYDVGLPKADGSNLAAIASSDALFEQLVTFPTPVPDLLGPQLDLDARVPGLLGRLVALAGQRQRVTVATDGLVLRARLQKRALKVGDSLVLLGYPAPDPDGARLWWPLLDDDGLQGVCVARDQDLLVFPARSGDAFVSEIAYVADVADVDERTTVTLGDLDHEKIEQLANVYDPSTLTIDGNVVHATNGATQPPIALGSGDASVAGQSFALPSKPLTVLAPPAPLPLLVRVGGIEWTRVDTLYDQGPNDRVYVARTDASGTTTIVFGDGVHGSRLPNGRDNVVATWRVGLGTAGNLPANTIINPYTTSPGIRGVTNPIAATGGVDPEPIENGRTEAPLSARTLGRVVSISDFGEFVRLYPGIAKVAQTELWTGRRKIVHLTVASDDPDDHTVSDATLADIRADVVASWAGGTAFVVQSYDRRWFRVEADVGADPDRDGDDVLAAVLAAVGDAFGFDRRELGAGVSGADVLEVMQGVDGVRDVRLRRLEPVIDNAQTAAEAASLVRVHAISTVGPNARIEGISARWDQKRAWPAGMLLVDMVTSVIRLERR